jgi:hypothetical protein
MKRMKREEEVLLSSSLLTLPLLSLMLNGKTSGHHQFSKKISATVAH